MQTVEIWRAGGGLDTVSIGTARQLESEGWDGQAFMDSQSLGGDPYVLMGAWAMATQRLKLATGVTNPLTRHPVVTAAAAATLQAISGGRAVLGIGRGDSALAHLGHGPVTVAAFHRALVDLQTLLSGGEVAFGAYESAADAPSLETLSLGGKPSACRLKWLPADLPKVPLDVAASGPKVIEMAAQIAERVTFSVGASAERIAWALELARAARRRVGLGDNGVSFGAQLIVVCHPDIDAVRETATSFVAPLARFQVIQGNAAGPQRGSDAENFAAIRKNYDMNEHGKHVSSARLSGAQLSWDFVQRFAIVGPPEHCVARLRQLIALGLDRFVVVGPGFHAEARGNGPGLFATEVMPALRGMSC
jgi:5,10-methylenetetrahydromethanopterin reductase